MSRWSNEKSSGRVKRQIRSQIDEESTSLPATISKIDLFPQAPHPVSPAHSALVLFSDLHRHYSPYYIERAGWICNLSAQGLSMEAKTWLGVDVLKLLGHLCADVSLHSSSLSRPSACGLHGISV
jgi:hypothetical protein